MIRTITPLVFLIVVGCSDSITDMTCSNVASEAIQISEGKIIAINSQQETNRSNQRLTCHGIAFTKSGDETPIRFQAFKSDDGETLVKYDDYEHQAALNLLERRKEQQEQARDEQQVQQTVDHTLEEIRHDTYGASAPD